VDDALIDAVAVAGTPEQLSTAAGALGGGGLDAPHRRLAARCRRAEQIALCGEILVPAWREVR